MVFHSLSFVAFFAIVFLLFWKLPKKYQWVLLLLAGYYFYASWKPAYLGIIVVTTLLNYFFARLIHEKPKQKKLFLLITIVFNIGTLLLFKYLGFFSHTVESLFDVSLPNFEILLPIGISFYTLQLVGYLADVYQEKIQPEKHLGHFAVFTCFFPQLAAGPIERGNTLLPQLKKLHTFDYNQVSEGVRLFTFGLFKKLVIADNLGIVVDRAFTTLPEYKGISLLLIMLFYSWQIYMDFSGYTDMARGVAKMIGINLLENFNLPYLATSIQDFWRRWHISFSSWLRDYIYFPLGGSRLGLLRTILNTLIVFVVSGLWHGAAWTFVVWGLLHGIGISLERVLKKLTGDKVKLPTAVKIAYTYAAVTLLWVFFRAPTLTDAFYVLRNMFSGVRNFISPSYLQASILQTFDFNIVEIVITLSLLGVAILLEIIQRKTKFLSLLDRQPVIVRFATYTLLVFLIVQLRNAHIQEFIYVRF